MTKERKIILEIAVDRQNEKGVFVAREMLSTLYDVLSSEKNPLFGKKKSPQFRFFIVHAGARIRFFFETPEKHKEFLESQLYAHYNNIEITQSSLPFENSTEFFVQEAHLANISDNLIKLYVNLKDRTEKETIDPLSPLTSVLSHSHKNEIAFFRVDFSPLDDTVFRSEKSQKIISAKTSDFVKIIQLKDFWWLKFLTLPFVWIFAIFRFFVTPTAKIIEEKNTEKTENEKFATFGYSTRLVMASTRQNRTRELSG